MKLSLNCVQVQPSFLNKKLKKKKSSDNNLEGREERGDLGLECSGVDSSRYTRATLLQNKNDSKQICSVCGGISIAQR